MGAWRLSGMARSTYDSESLLVGVVGRPHGLDGEMTLRAYNNQGANLALVPELIFETPGSREVRPLRTARRRADGWLVRVEGVASREAAAALTHASVRVRKQALPPLAPGEFFVEDLLGCRVTTEHGDELGTVESIFWNGAHDVLSVVGVAVGSPGAKATEHLIPLVPAFLQLVDVPARRVVVRWDPQDGDPARVADRAHDDADRTNPDHDAADHHEND